MIIKNKLDKPFGPSGTFAGLVIFSAGVGILFYSPGFGITFILLGTFVGFTYTLTYINTDKKCIRYVHKIFGIFPLGKWVYVKPSMKILLRRSHQGFRSYSYSNRKLDIHQVDYRLVLTDYNGNEIAELKKEKDTKEAERSRSMLRDALKIN